MNSQDSSSLIMFSYFLYLLRTFLMKPGFLLGKPSNKLGEKQQESAQEQQRERYDASRGKGGGNRANNHKPYRKKEVHETQTVLDRSEQYIHQKQAITYKLHQQEAKFLLDEILQYIYDVADRNEVYRSNFVHLLIPLGMTLKMLDVGSDRQHQSYLRSVIKAIVAKLKQKPQLRLQLSSQEQYDQFMILIAHPSIAQSKLLQFMRKFLLSNKEIMIALLPYYYNFFALAVNKEVVFRGEQAQLLEYSVDLKHPLLYNGSFTRKDVCDLVDKLERLLIDKYHSNDI